MENEADLLIYHHAEIGGCSDFFDDMYQEFYSRSIAKAALEIFGVLAVAGKIKTLSFNRYRICCIGGGDYKDEEKDEEYIDDKLRSDKRLKGAKYLGTVVIMYQKFGNYNCLGIGANGMTPLNHAFPPDIQVQIFTTPKGYALFTDLGLTIPVIPSEAFSNASLQRMQWATELLRDDISKRAARRKKIGKTLLFEDLLPFEGLRIY